jgi:hypothetical protein
MILRDQMIRHDELMGSIDSILLLICRFARAPWSRCFWRVTGYNKDYADRQTFYGFRLPLRLG